MTSHVSNAGTRSLADATCLGCGCLCDDIRLAVEANRIVRAELACPIGERWFLAERPAGAAPARIDGRPATLEAALARAAAILTAAEHPLLFGLVAATCSAQRAAVALADRLGACLDIGEPAAVSLAAASQSSGIVTATLGEVRHRADLVVFWRVDPATTHPRHFERYSLSCRGEFIPRGRADRWCLVVDDRRTATADVADAFYEIAPSAEAASLAVLHALATDAPVPDTASTRQQTGVELARWQALSERMKAARYIAIFFKPNAATESLLLLTRDMNRHARCVALPLGSPGNAAGAPQVLTWQTGYPSAVDFAAGYPECDLARNPAETLLTAGDVDAALLPACDPLADPMPKLSQSARDKLAAIPSIFLRTADYEPTTVPTVAITVASPGIDAEGTVFRSDGIALPLRPALTSPYPSAEEVLLAIQQRLEPSTGTS